MAFLSDEQMLEICGARERLRAYRDKIQPYPSLTVESESNIELRLSELEAKQGEPGSMPRYYLDRTQQLEGRVLHAEAKLNKHIDEGKRKKQEDFF